MRPTLLTLTVLALTVPCAGAGQVSTNDFAAMSARSIGPATNCGKKLT